MFPTNRIGALVLAFAVVAAAGVIAWAMGGLGNRSSPSGTTPVHAADFHTELLAILGDEAGADANTLGLVGDVALGGGGNIFVLDIADQRLLLFNDGTARVLGRMGRGPGEFMEAVAVASGERSPAYVLDRQNRRIEVFDGGTGDRVGALPLVLNGEDLCAWEGRLFVLGAHGGHLLHEISTTDGRIVRSFAPDEESKDLLMQAYRARGYLQCGPGDQIAFLPLLRPDVTLFSAGSGERQATVSLPHYAGVVVSREERGVRFEAPGQDGHDFASSIVPLRPFLSLVQVGRIRPRSSVHEFRSLRSYLVDWRGGTVRQVRGLPRIIASQHDTLLVAATSPYPRVEVQRLVSYAEDR